MRAHRGQRQQRHRGGARQLWGIGVALAVGVASGCGAVLVFHPDAIMQIAQASVRSPWISAGASPRASAGAASRSQPNWCPPTMSPEPSVAPSASHAGRHTAAPSVPASAAAPSSAAPSAAAPSSGAAAAAPPASGTTAAPNSDLPGWKLELSEDFNTPAPLGSFAKIYPNWAGYDTWRDTSRDLGRPTVSQGLYDSSTTTSVSGGMLDEYIHTDGSTPQVVGLTPPIKGTSNTQTYGRYAIRFRSDSIPGYKLAWLLWPDSNDWTQGEVDFPEGALGDEIDGFAHDTSGDPSANAWAVNTNTSMSDWHTVVIEWSPGTLAFQLDGKSWSTTNANAIPKNPMSWVLQTETQLSATAPAKSASGHVQIDWIAAWSKA